MLYALYFLQHQLKLKKKMFHVKHLLICENIFIDQ